MAWIDYRKAYDSVPHSWILESLKLYKVDNNILKFIKTSMNHWSTKLHSNNKEIAEVDIKCGIYQGDSLSPLLFCIALNLLSNLIAKTRYGYKFRSGATINHLMYMDDIKLYAKHEHDIDSLIHLTSLQPGHQYVIWFRQVFKVDSKKRKNNENGRSQSARRTNKRSHKRI